MVGVDIIGQALSHLETAERDSLIQRWRALSAS
jgi:hypothetical protein